MSLYSIPSKKKWRKPKGLRHVFFTLYVQNIKSEGGIWTFFQIIISIQISNLHENAPVLWY